MPLPQVKTGTFTAVGDGAGFLPLAGGDGIARFNVAVWGVFDAVLALQQSFDGGANWLPSTYADGSKIEFTTQTTYVGNEFEAGVLYRVSCASYNSGTASWRISQ